MTLAYGTGTDQTLGGGAAANTAFTANATLTTTWQRFTLTGSVPTTATQLVTMLTLAPTGTAGANDYFEVTGVQLEVGSVATPFHTFSTTIEGELAACQRYYQRFSFSASNYSGGFGTAGTTTSAIILFPRSVSMRVTPTAIENSTVQVYDGISSPASVTLTNGSSSPDALVVTAAGGFTAFRPYFIIGGAGASYVGFTAEL